MSDHTQKKTSNTLRPPYDWPLGPSHPLILLLAHVVPAMPASLLFLLPLVGILGSLTLVDRLEDYYSSGLVQETNRHGFDPWVGKIPWRRAGNPPPYCCLENPMDRGAGGLRSMGSQRVGHYWSSLAHTACTQAIGVTSARKAWFISSFIQDQFRGSFPAHFYPSFCCLPFIPFLYLILISSFGTASYLTSPELKCNHLYQDWDTEVNLYNWAQSRGWEKE